MQIRGRYPRVGLSIDTCPMSNTSIFVEDYHAGIVSRFWVVWPTVEIMAMQTAAIKTSMMLYSIMVAPVSLLMTSTIFSKIFFKFTDAPIRKRCVYGAGAAGILLSTAVKASNTEDPRVVITPMLTAAIRATIIPYSTMVAPSSSLKKLIRFFIFNSPSFLVAGC